MRINDNGRMRCICCPDRHLIQASRQLFTTIYSFAKASSTGSPGGKGSRAKQPYAVLARSSSLAVRACQQSTSVASPVQLSADPLEPCVLHRGPVCNKHEPGKELLRLQLSFITARDLTKTWRKEKKRGP
nr:hypothetical protein Iba_chr09bCG5680 [Ipomoea batatas]